MLECNCPRCAPNVWGIGTAFAHLATAEVSSETLVTDRDAEAFAYFLSDPTSRSLKLTV